MLEIAEELGLDVSLGQLLVVDWVPPQPDGRPALVNFVFDGGTITPTQAAGLRLQDSELRAWRLCTWQEADALLGPVWEVHRGSHSLIAAMVTVAS
ncbi:hypothetical protein [Parafrankia sp. FMc2]|uniref:hypothetical protein n=1 Tax=Parafrankia sp. FMc2 TaxID=3233196 RepID=UPI0034D602D5